MTNNSGEQTVVSVAEMARQCSLSRQRFHQLRREGIFVEPDYDPDTGRPYYNSDKQAICLEVRRRNVGVNGKPILFYARRSDVGVTRRPRKATAPKPARQHDVLIERLKGLGLAVVTAAQVDAAIKSSFPNGTDGVDEAEVVRAVFVEIKAKGSQ